jgi:hypothetical protein
VIRPENRRFVVADRLGPGRKGVGLVWRS